MRLWFVMALGRIADCGKRSMISSGVMRCTHFLTLFATFTVLMLGSAFANDLIRIREGDTRYGKVILTIDDEKVRLGDSKYGEIVFIIDGDHIRKGDSKYGKVIATANPDGRIIEGKKTYGPVVARVLNGKVREGNSKHGPAIAHTEGGLMAGAAAACFLLLQ